MKTTIKIIYIAIILLISSTNIAICQNDSTINLWGNAGIVSSAKDRIGFQFGFNYNKNKNVLSLRYYQNEEFLVGFPFKDPSINNIQKIQNFSLLYGYSFGNKYIKLTPMAGLSAGHGNWRNDKVDITKSDGLFSIDYRTYHYNKFDYLGLHLNLGFMWTPTKYFGIGFDIFENIHKHPDNGFAVNIIIGKVRM